MILTKIKSPILFQGNLKKRHYFEGWFYKQVSKDEKSVVSFIPGISLFDNDLHSFVQYMYIGLDRNGGKVIKSGYVKYPLKEFTSSNDPFMIRIGKNIFSESMVSVNMTDGKMNIKGDFNLGKITPIKRSILMPNIMGFFAYIPKMECYHGVISMNHEVNGILKINSEDIDFNNGKGYIEKDWGTSFPKRYIWIQCNNFKNKTTSVFSSAACIPFMGKSFRGYISNLSVDGKEYRFATYNNSILRIKSITNQNAVIVFENKKAKLKIEAASRQPAELIAPQEGKMQKKIKEELSGEVKIHLYNNQNKVIYEDVGCMAGIEVVGFIRCRSAASTSWG